MAYVNEFAVWENGVPVIVIAGDSDFAVWDNEVPIVDQDESNPNAQPRRQAEVIRPK